MNKSLSSLAGLIWQEQQIAHHSLSNPVPNTPLIDFSLLFQQLFPNQSRLNSLNFIYIIIQKCDMIKITKMRIFFITRLCYPILLIYAPIETDVKCFPSRPGRSCFVKRSPTEMKIFSKRFPLTGSMNCALRSQIICTITEECRFIHHRSSSVQELKISTAV